MSDAEQAKIEAFLAALPNDQRRALERLRADILKAAPGITEKMSYGVPTFVLGKSIVSMGAAKQHCALYVMSLPAIATLVSDLQGYDWSGGTIRFQPEKPLPAALVRKVVKTRIAEVQAAAKKRARWP
jgi:uncharacterized protein YdhG (YjbR/CyaY superfamily)